jgi:hypothetical protein
VSNMPKCGVAARRRLDRLSRAAASPLWRNRETARLLPQPGHQRGLRPNRTTSSGGGDASSSGVANMDVHNTHIRSGRSIPRDSGGGPIRNPMPLGQRSCPAQQRDQGLTEPRLPMQC